ncbi:hypothetical protein FRC98_12740 [Lujinxingia vulgaris]|uniref:Right handed beta helix domain-containing protein n=1 Tax=Lujinxingia vulgaris TaxID=2600176 RepID=A0A5C6X683_9DELT|nr:hypothetical protein [Lujinxingia vulgaris]TXD36690.1 hypothetical protein FRC98_12740 [Lujinxingia vulgaris]
MMGRTSVWGLCLAVAIGTWTGCSSAGSAEGEDVSVGEERGGSDEDADVAGGEDDSGDGRDGGLDGGDEEGGEGDGGSVDGGAEEDGGSTSGCVAPSPPSFDYVVAPGGRAGGAGTLDDPLSLEAAFSEAGPVGPGDRVMLRGGVYEGRYAPGVSGEEGAPVVFFAEPGERVTLDSGSATGVGSELDTGVLVEGEWVELRGLEVTSSAERSALVSGLTIYGANTKLINSVIHDTAQGISFWKPAVDSELYGNIIFNNGYEGTSRGHGHAIYTQNLEGTKRIADNVIFFGYAFGLHAYTEGGDIQGFDIEKNVWFRTGASRPGASRVGISDGALIGGLQPVARATLRGNHSWAPTINARSTRVGWGGSVQNEDITFLDNYLVGLVAAQGHWSTGVLENNAFYSELSGIDPAMYPDNLYGGSLPTENRVVLQVNEYSAGRAHLIIYNWEMREEVEVDLGAFADPGASYTIRSVYDVWGPPVAQGTYEGEGVRVPMGSVAPPQPAGDLQGIIGDDDPGAAFGVFVVEVGCL